MIADWTVEIGPESPEIVVPWEGWIDLSRIDLNRLDPSGSGTSGIGEAVAYGELVPLLAHANSSAMLSSKVDVFPVTREEVDPEIGEAGPVATACGLGSYLDLLLRKPTPGFQAFEQLAREAVRQLAQVELPLACVEIVVRPARLYDEDTFGLTLYSMGFGPNAQAARAVWQHAAAAAVVSLHAAWRVTVAAHQAGE